MVELEQMKDTMERMELERAEMVAEVEAQIERALQSMAVELDDSDYSDSRPGSSMSNHSGMSGGRSRKISEITMRPLRSFPTESTLAESYGEGRDDTLVSKIERHTETIEEDEEEDRPVSPSKKKRFSATRDDLPQDGMTAVDEGISQKSDGIAKKVWEIQQKVILM
jgi:EEF1A N-terminal glycine/lysine methyltransferase